MDGWTRCLTCLGVEKLFFAVHPERLDTHGERRRDYADVMIAPSACPRGAASPQTSQTAKHAHCNKKNIYGGGGSTDTLAPGAIYGSGKVENRANALE